MRPFRRLRLLRRVRGAGRRVGRLDERGRCSRRAMRLLFVRRWLALAAGLARDDVDDETMDGLVAGREMAA